MIPEAVPEFSVSELSSALKKTLETRFGRVCVRGEISGSKKHTSGHFYFALKDEAAVLDAVCWRGTLGRLSMVPEDGMEVICVGRITTYAGRSKYQMIIESMSLAGQGAILKLLEERKKKLLAEGLFDPLRKKEIPFLPTNIGLVTSQTGAVIQDILHRIRDRFPRNIYLWPVAVQGKGAPEEIVTAVDGLNAVSGQGCPPLDVLIVARGGGSLEDLWAFNEESVVRAVARSHIPVISAVGHETDTTLIDFAADRRAPTPTAAAEMAVPVHTALVDNLKHTYQRLALHSQRFIQMHSLKVQTLFQHIPPQDTFLYPFEQGLDDKIERLMVGIEKRLSHKEQIFTQTHSILRPPHPLLERYDIQLSIGGEQLSKNWDKLTQFLALRLTQTGQLLDKLSYTQTLKRGFSRITDAQGRTRGSAKDIPVGTPLTVHFCDGTLNVTTEVYKPSSTKIAPASEH